MKKESLFIAIVLVVSLMMGCSTNPMVSIYNNDEKIASATNSYNLNEVEQATEEGHFTASVEKMEGMDTIWSYDAEGEELLDIQYSLTVLSGKMKIVLIDPNGEVFVIAECDNSMEEPISSTFKVKKGNNRIKIVASENTIFDADISIPTGEFKELG